MGTGAHLKSRQGGEGDSLYLSFLAGGIALLALYWISTHNYLLFHSVAEMFSIVVASCIFMVAWNARRTIENNYLLFLGIAYPFVAALDLLHTLAYKGMGVFPGYDTNLPTQLWIAARYMEGLSLLVAPLFLGRRLKAYRILSAYGGALALLLGVIFYWKGFPICFVEGEGLTAFKKWSEYVICMILLGSVAHLYRWRGDFEPGVLKLIAASILMTAVSEMFFTLYVHAYGLSNLLGHFLKIISFYLIYKALIETGLMRPFSVLFRNLKKSEEELQRARDRLEIRVQERTAELAEANRGLVQEIRDRRRAEEALRESEEKYSILVEASLTGVYIQQDGIIRFANERMAEIHGYSREEILGMKSLDLVHPEDRAMVDLFRNKRLKGLEGPEEYEARGLTKDGKTIWVTRRNRGIIYEGRPAVLGNLVDITARKRMAENLVRSERDLRQLSSQLLAAEEKERKRIAQELHDSIGQSLGAIKFSVENCLAQMAGVLRGPVEKSLKDIIPLIQKTVDEVRRIVMDLRPSTLDDLGVLPTISWFCREFQMIYSNIEIEKEIDLEERDVPDQLKTAIYRVLQEALNNVAKHGGATLVRLSLKKRGGRIEMNIKDNGVGFDPEKVLTSDYAQRGFGLASMRERTEFIGGKFNLESAVGAGTVIRVSWPI